jgi:tetratricopeptide (TPR) repeat protein
MNIIKHVSIVFLTLICLNTYAQDYSKMSTDSLKTEILKTLNNKKNELWFSYNDPKRGGWDFIKFIEATNIDNYNLILKAKKKKIISVSLNKHITYESKDSYDRIIIDDSLIIINYRKQHIIEFYRLVATLQNRHISEIVEKKLAEFQKIATSYKTLSERPTVTEEQRKYIVQANSKNEKKEYKEALEFYNKAINVNPISYPSAYNNMALLAAQIKDYWYAILNMKKYLMLVPGAEDARAAQDKIYEWEAELEK